MTRLLIINPNTSASVSARLAEMAQATLPAGAAVEVVTARFGAPYISSEAAVAVAAHAALQACADHVARHGRPGAVLVGCFGDPGLLALRELAGVPVTGLAEAAMQAASAQGPYAIVTGGAAWAPMLERLAASLGLARNLTGIVTVEKTGAELAADPAAAQTLLLEACRQALRGDPDGRRPRSLVLGGAALAGMGDALAPRLEVALLDSVRCGLLAAWALAQSGSPSGGAGSTMAAIDWQGEAAGLKVLAQPGG